MKRVFIIGTVLAALLAPSSAVAKNVDALGVLVSSCVVNSKDNLTNGINVVYYNSHATPAIEVDFLVRYHGHAYTLIDRGTFSQGAPINHNLTNALVGQPWQGATPKLCTPSRVILQNGKAVE
jgi:hypothetical protein